MKSNVLAHSGGYTLCDNVLSLVTTLAANALLLY